MADEVFDTERTARILAAKGRAATDTGREPKQGSGSTMKEGFIPIVDEAPVPPPEANAMLPVRKRNIPHKKDEQ